MEYTKNNNVFYLYKVEIYINMTNIEGVFFQTHETDKEIAKLVHKIHTEKVKNIFKVQLIERKEKYMSTFYNDIKFLNSSYIRCRK